MSADIARGGAARVAKIAGVTGAGIGLASAAGSVGAGAYLARYQIDHVVCSTAERTRQTWKRAQAGGASATTVDFNADVYEATLDDLLGALARDMHQMSAVVEREISSEISLRHGRIRERQAKAAKSRGH